jgi:hypothetical protein
MPTLCQIHPTADEADTAVAALLSSGIAEIRVLTGSARVDAPVGSFAGAAAGPAGSFADAPAEGMGSYAGAITPGMGSFGDIDREMIVTIADGVPRVRIASHRDLTALLVEAGLDAAAAAKDVAALHGGKVLVLYRAG